MLLRAVNFYPRSPCGERQSSEDANDSTNGFLSTLSLRRATRSETHDRHKTRISIHALLAESDLIIKISFLFHLTFLSTLSLRRATARTPTMEVTEICISIHALLAESDQRRRNRSNPNHISIHALLAESDKCTP